jgi:hypothetical protein
MTALWSFTILALAYAFAIEGFGKTRDDARHQGTDGGAAPGSEISFHDRLNSLGER